VLVTGAAGFIGSAFVRRLLAGDGPPEVLGFDALTYAGHEENLRDMPHGERHRLWRGDVAEAADLEAAFAAFRPDAVVHFAAETHVDRSILDPEPFVRTNVLGTQVLLGACRRAGVRLVAVSTDEVYGDLPPGQAARPGDALRPNNVYAATKAAGDMLVQAAWHTHGQDVLLTRSTNTYGPRQVPEKLVPLMILRAQAGETLPVYGDGLQVRDWLHADDHAEGVRAALALGRAGAVYHFAGAQARANLEVVRAVAQSLGADEERIVHVGDRPGHDRRYALDDRGSREELGWAPRIGFEEGLAATVRWYRGNAAWCRAVAGPRLRAFLEANYGARERL
jgi:dTDP-glucose 4,6-dehydratase